MVNDKDEYGEGCFDVPDFLNFKSVWYMDKQQNMTYLWNNTMYINFYYEIVTLLSFYKKKLYEYYILSQSILHFIIK